MLSLSDRFWYLREDYKAYTEPGKVKVTFLSQPPRHYLARIIMNLDVMRVDKMPMATSVEARVPFLDHHLVEYAMSLPAHLKIKGTSGKHILKRALEKVLPAEVLYSRKRGFGAPIREWFRGTGGEMLGGLIMNSSIRRRDLFDYGFIARLMDEHRSGKRDWSFHLWALLNVSLWYERWIDRG